MLPNRSISQPHLTTLSNRDPLQSAPSRPYFVPPPYWSGTIWLWEEDCSDSSDVSKTGRPLPANGRRRSATLMKGLSRNDGTRPFTFLCTYCRRTQRKDSDALRHHQEGIRARTAPQPAARDRSD